MKNLQKGSVAITLLIIIIVLLVIGIGIYLYQKNNQTNTQQACTQEAKLCPDGSSVGRTGPNCSFAECPTSATTTQVSVAGMQQYTDSVFGFSFWYPVGWQVVVATSTPFGNSITGATVVKKLSVGHEVGQTYPDVLIQEVHSSHLSITDTGGGGPFGPITYYFDPNDHAWMVVKNAGGPDTFLASTTADITLNTMGGLHMFGGTSRFDTNIIPLSAENFLVISDGGGYGANVLAKTVVALDSSVATPVSQGLQIQTIQAEATAYAANN